jgi:hypothetical protein
MDDKSKPDLRDKAKSAASLRDTDLKSPIQPAQPEDPATDLHTVKPGVGAQAEGQTTRS